MSLNKRRMSLISALLVLLLLVAVACDGNDEPEETNEPAETATEVADVAEAPTPTNEPMAAPTEELEPTEEPEPTEEATEVPEPTPVPTEEPAAPAYDILYEEASCEFDEPDGFDIQCGWLTVPENRAQLDNGRTVRLHVAVFLSDNPDKPADPVVYLEGGPGGDALETIPLAFTDRFGPFVEDRDFIMFDQRGTGYSEPSLACPETLDLAFETIEQDLTDEEGIALSLAALEACRVRLVEEGVDLSAYTSAENAADLNDLRTALGYDEWNLYGISYGTRLAQTAVRDFPAGVRSVILDSAYPIESNLLTETPRNLDRALDELFEGCAADAECAAAYPELAATLWDTVAMLEAESAPIQIFDLMRGETYDSFFDGDTLIGIVFQGLYSEQIIPILPEMIYAANQGDYTLVETLLSAFLLNSEFISAGMQYAVQCNEEAVFTAPGSAAAAVAEHPELAGFFAGALNVSEAMLDICTRWGVSEAPAIENEAITNDIPTLVMAGEYDPITPPRWGEQVAANLSGSYYFLYPGVGHGASVSGDCPLRMARAFLNDPTVEPDDTCIAGMEAPDFSVSGEIGEIAFVEYSSDLFGISGLVPEGWDEAVDGVFVRGNSAADQTLIIFQGLPDDVGEDFFLGILEEQLQMAEAPELTQELVVGDLTWKLYRAEGLGQRVDIGTTIDGGVIVTVVMVSSAAERDALYEAVFLPIVESAMAQ